MAGKPYQQEALRSIGIMRRNGMSIPAIAESLGRTQAGIQNKIRVLGLADPARSTAMRAVRKFTPEQKNAFREFISTHYSGHTAIDIRDAWNREAAARGWPVVNADRVRYYRRQSGQRPTKGECLQFGSYRQKQRQVQRLRRRTESENRRQVLRHRRAELYAGGQNLSKRKCQVCEETWPLTDEFFRKAGSHGNYYLNTCKLCVRAADGNTAEERRVQRMEAYDRSVAVKQISHAACERDAFLHAHRAFPTRRCCRCHETWELLATRYPKYKGANGTELYRKTCRFCLRAAERLKERERNALCTKPTNAAYTVNGFLQDSL
jgi:hypothetical protein